MKVKCEFCGKKYDVESNNGRCPVCGASYSGYNGVAADNVNYESNAMGSVNYEPNKMENVNYKPKFARNIKQSFNAAANVEKKKKAYSIGEKIMVVCCSIVIGMIALVAIAEASLIGEDKKKYESLKEHMENSVETISEEEASINDNIEYKKKDNTIVDISILSIKKIDSYSDKIPEGYELIQVSYIMDDGNDESYNIYGVSIEPLMKTKSGAYIEALDKADCNSLFDTDYSGLEESNIGAGLEYRKGKFYYIVKENDCDSLVMSLFSYDYDYSIKSIDKLIKISIPEGYVE